MCRVSTKFQPHSGRDSCMPSAGRVSPHSSVLSFVICFQHPLSAMRIERSDLCITL